MQRRNFLVLSGAGLAAAGLTACGGSGSGGSGGGESSSEVEVFTWWAQGSEKAGLDALVA
ncbi:MAG: twin-arginine translocation signal domain-containing protein, partial [Brachybacterium sp.]|nr:twin-arginine translocation signal domain-containing protein [Brachybacterium sp.]